jgi:uncharacterized protein YaiE (UPF0345 family)
MSEFKNVTIIKKANIYFDGKVTSTAEMEIMEILAGELDVMLPRAASWITVKGGGVFEVPAQSKFSLKVKSLTDYCCSYVR